MSVVWSSVSDAFTVPLNAGVTVGALAGAVAASDATGAKTSSAMNPRMIRMSFSRSTCAENKARTTSAVKRLRLAPAGMPFYSRLSRPAAPEQEHEPDAGDQAPEGAADAQQRQAGGGGDE